MAIPLTINGSTFDYPENFDENWGVNATGWAQAVTNGMLQMAGGNFPITADINFGANFGLLSKYFETRTSNPATAGTVRLASADAGIGFRNNANSGNLILTTNSSDQLLYNGHPIGSSGGGAVTSITGTTNQVIASASVGDITLSLPQNIATTSTPTFASLTLSSPLTVANGGSGVTSHTAYAVITGGTTSGGGVQSVASVGTTGQVLTSNGPGALPTFANTTGSGTVNSGTQYQLAYYATAGATISGNPNTMAATQSVVTDTNGVPTTTGNGGTTATEIAFVHGVTSAIQTQINTKAPSASPTFTGTVTIPNGAAATSAAAFGQIFAGFQAPVQGTSTTTFSTTNSVYQTSNLSATITPTSASHRIKVTCSFTASTSGAGQPQASLFRGATDLDAATNGFIQGNGWGSTPVYFPCSIVYIDSPATTSATTYSVKLKSLNGATTVSIGQGIMQVMTLEEIV